MALSWASAGDASSASIAAILSMISSRHLCLSETKPTPWQQVPLRSSRQPA